MNHRTIAFALLVSSLLIWSAHAGADAMRAEFPVHIIKLVRDMQKFAPAMTKTEHFP